MPQLLPTPWFMTLIFAWVVFLGFVPTKVMSHSFSNEPTSVKPQKLEKDFLKLTMGLS
ncbi:ATP synthase F0 subunit 8 (mitochondrion) [Plectropomus leopardus]|uniref:ATP synthase complex subunit 8 n=1 Tax=Plectropomus leopardus TaxID=160734 RepID=Q07DT3_PLELO|nr:ATP synthase F0 subunit 8 [Plectropomus leopardus]AAY89403.1 ATP synthase F0 subunit 8 [Plectropomus leopardus]